MSYESYLQHHGIKGMHLGVRRYRNYDGSYTKKGLEKYHKFEGQYQKAKGDYKQSKSDFKAGKNTKADVREAKTTMKEAKHKLSRSYDQVKKDYAGDKGKELYRRGKTITGNDAKFRTAKIIATSSEGCIRNAVGDTIKMELMSILKGEYVNPHVSIWYYQLDDIKEVGNPSMWLKANPNLGNLQ